MHYWNAQNFEGLKAIGEEYSARAGYELFGRYCLLKEAGLKKKAVSVIKEYVDLIKKEPVGRQRELVVELASIGFWNSAVHQLIAHPLEQFLKEVLSHWAILLMSRIMQFRTNGWAMSVMTCLHIEERWKLSQLMKSVLLVSHRHT